MPSPLRTVDPARLLARRVQAGLTRNELASRVGVSRRMIFFYEQGAHTPTPARLERLAEALGCDFGALTGAVRGRETLVDLRYTAGLTLDRTAEVLCGSAAGRELHVSASKISALENGQPVRGAALVGSGCDGSAASAAGQGVRGTGSDGSGRLDAYAAWRACPGASRQRGRVRRRPRWRRGGR